MRKNQLEQIAAGISEEDRKLILSGNSNIRRSRIEVTNDSNQDTAVTSGNTDTSRSRNSVKREYPKPGDKVKVKNPWTDEEFTVDVVKNDKRKHGIEFAYKNKRWHSPSPMCLWLFKKRVSSGWKYITW